MEVIMDNQEDDYKKVKAKDVAKTFIGMINYSDEAYEPDLTLDEFEDYYKKQLKKAKPDQKKDLEDLINLVSILKKQQAIVDKEMKIGDFSGKALENSKAKEPKTKEEAEHQVKKIKDETEKVIDEIESEKKKKKKKEEQLKRQAELEIQNLSNEQSRTKNNEGD